jgi:hypothetical protein
MKDWLYNARRILQLVEGVDYTCDTNPQKRGKILRFTASAGADLLRFARDPGAFRSTSVAMRRKVSEALEKGSMVCSGCGEEKPLSDFERDLRTASRAPTGKCRRCRLSRKAFRRTRGSETLEGALKPLLSNAQARSKKKGWTCSLGLADLIEQWDLQQGLCFYTGAPMVHRRQHTSGIRGVGGLQRCPPDNVSIDRKDSSLGYERGNVVLCRYIANCMKQDIPIPLWLETMREILRLHT